VLASVPILNMPAKSETAASTPGKAEVEIVAPEIADDGELCQYCIRCFTSSLQSLQDRDKLEVCLPLFVHTFSVYIQCGLFSF